MGLWHSSENSNCSNSTDNDDEESELLEIGEEFVEEDCDGDAEPANYEEGDENVPWLDNVVGVIQTIHLHAQFRHDVDDRS